jgi:hypothetical protein
MTIDATVVAVAVEVVVGTGTAATAFASAFAATTFDVGVAVATTSATFVFVASTFVTFVTFAGPARLAWGSAIVGNVTSLSTELALSSLDISSGVLLDTDFTQGILELEVRMFSKTRADEKLRQVVKSEAPSEFLSLGDRLDAVVRGVVDTVKEPFGLFRFVRLVLTVGK